MANPAFARPAPQNLHHPIEFVDAHHKIHTLAGAVVRDVRDSVADHAPFSTVGQPDIRNVGGNAVCVFELRSAW